MRHEQARSSSEGTGRCVLARRLTLLADLLLEWLYQERESTHTTDYAEAVKTLQRKLGEVAVGKSAGAERIRIAALLHLLIDDYRLHDRADLQEAEQRVNKLLKPEFWAFARRGVLDEGTERIHCGAQKEGRQNSTINRELAGAATVLQARLRT